MIYLVCEGNNGKLDQQVLDKIVVNKLGKINVKLAAAGGDSSLRSIANYLEDSSRRNGSSRPSDKAYVIEDRNYRSITDVDERWNRAEGKFFFWHRHEIENYLLDPRVIFNTLAELKKAPKIPKHVSFPESEGEALRLMEQLAQPLLEDHAGWSTWKKIQDQHHLAAIGLLGFTKNQLTLASSSVSQFPDQNSWIAYLKQECQRMQKSSQALSIDPTFQEDQIESQYLQILSNIQSEIFEDQRFLSELGGHELLSQLMYYLHKLNVKISLEDLQTRLVNTLDHMYIPNFFQPDDFNELARRLI